MKKITLTPEQLEDLLGGEENVKGFEGWEADADHSTGDFDSEKGAMTDYEITLYDPHTKTTYEAQDGYYTAVTGDVFNGNIEFTAKVKKVKKVKKANLTESEIQTKLKKIIFKSDIKTVKKILNKIK